MSSLTSLIPPRPPLSGPVGAEWDRLAESGDWEVPDDSAEEWRYSSIADLDPADYRVVPTRVGGTTPVGATPARTTDLGTLGVVPVIRVIDGVLVAQEGALPPGVTLTRWAELPAEEAVALFDPDGPDVFARWNALASDPIVVDIAPGSVLAEPLVIGVHSGGGQDRPPAVATQLIVRCGERVQAQVVEVHTSAGGSALLVPRTRLMVGQGAMLDHVVVQDVDPAAWIIAGLRAEVGSAARLRGRAAVLGGSRARLRIDCALSGRGAEGELTAVYLGTGDQLRDLRTFQDHLAPDTRSLLDFKGAVAGRSRAVYTGLIRIDHDAPRSDARQSNRILKLSEDAWAESVPNLEIHHNDVRCAHASTVGPIDEEQAFYLESRGVPPDAAERLVVDGFFAAVVATIGIADLEAALMDRVRAELGGTGENG